MRKSLKKSTEESVWGLASSCRALLTAEDRPRAMMGPRTSWPLPPTEGLPAMPFLHYARDAVIRDQARTVLQEEPLKDGCSRRAIGHARETAVE
jgi:hypothetical protein